MNRILLAEDDTGASRLINHAFASGVAGSGDRGIFPNTASPESASFSRINHDLENIRETMQQSLANFCLHLRADFGFLICPNDSGRLELHADFHLSEHMMNRLSALLSDYGNPVVAELAAMREGASIKSVYDFESGYPEYADIARQSGINSLLLLPLMRGNQRIGVVALFFRRPRFYRKETLELLTTSLSEAVYATADAEQLKLLKGRVESLWREGRLPLKKLKLPICDNGNCAENCEECSPSREFRIESAQDILMLISGLINSVAHYAKLEQRRAGDLESMVAKKTMELEKQKNKARETSNLKSEFLASMSHELRSPLNSIIGFAERIPSKIDKVYFDMDSLMLTLNADPNPAKGILSALTSMKNKELNTINKFCGYISNSGSHLLGLINDILDLSRIEAGKLEIAIEPVDFRLNVASVIASLSNSAEEKKLTLTSDIDSASTHEIMADKRRFNQILFNLVGNAVKFSKLEGAVKLTAKERPAQNKMEFCISDNGPGIKAEFQKHIFNRFEQADGSGILPGAGLGLAISKKLVELLGGDIWFESEPGRGSRFYFTVPSGNGVR